MRISDFADVRPILKGWSGDRKYRVTRPDGSLCLLRTASADQYERKKAEYEWMERVASLGVPICRPLEFGRCGEGVYTLFSWVEGEDAEPVIPRLSETEASRLRADGRRISAPNPHPAGPCRSGGLESPYGAGKWTGKSRCTMAALKKSTGAKL